MALTDYGVIVDLKPIGGGWRYMQLMNGELQRIPNDGSAVKASVLVRDVSTFRVNQGIPMGDVEQDIADYIKAVSPQNDRFRTTKGISIPRVRPVKPILQELREWLDELLPKHPMLVSKPEATERSMACLKCPQNIKWRANCDPCNEEVVYRGAMLRNLPTYGYDDALKACRLHRVYLPAAVFVDRESLPVRHSDAIVGCWMPVSMP